MSVNTLVLVAVCFSLYSVNSLKYISLHPSINKIRPVEESLVTEPTENETQIADTNFKPVENSLPPNEVVNFTQDIGNNSTSAYERKQRNSTEISLKWPNINDTFNSTEFLMRVKQFSDDELQDVLRNLLFLALSSSNHVDCSILAQQTTDDVVLKSRLTNIEELIRVRDRNRLFLCPPCKECDCCPKPIVIDHGFNYKREKRRKNKVTTARVTSGKKLIFANVEECFCPKCEPCSPNDCKADTSWKLPIKNKTLIKTNLNPRLPV